MPKRFLRIVARIVGTVLALVLIVYAILLIANLNDRPPSPAVSAIRSWQPAAADSGDVENSYVFMLGFSGPPESNPLTLGIEREAWLKTAAPNFDSPDDPFGNDYNFRGPRSDDVAELSRVCSESEAECLRMLESDKETVEQWLTDERWLLDRYRALIGMTKFRETNSFEVLAPQPSYGVMLEGQKLHFADAWNSASESDSAAVRDALDRDLTFWRMVLENSDVVITKMIATAAVVQHFKLGNLALRRLPAGTPASWRAPITNDERSMKRSLAGEWLFFERSNQRFAESPEIVVGEWTEPADQPLWSRALWAILRPLWQPQDLNNRHAQLLLDVGAAFDVPYEEVPGAKAIADNLHASAYRRFSRLYNLMGDLVMDQDYSSFSSYAVRVSDLEGIRRAALLASELRAAGTSKQDIAERIPTSELVDPYTNEPLGWSEDKGAIVFVGLEPHERGQHEIVY